MNSLKNRPEIDGLRAVAVVPVVMYHADLFFPGGYVGVDVFFVISGYLITSLILRDENFTIVGFWERRVRRILPAVSVVVAACMLAGWFMLLPRDFERLARSAVAQSLALSNVFFWRDSGYFAGDTQRPLLHTWSLAVEEQFYIFLPFLLVALRRFSRKTLCLVLAGIALLSFGVCVECTYFHSLVAFYLLPSRAWELLLGALLASLPNTEKPKGWVNECSSGAGLLASYRQLYATRATLGSPAWLPCFRAWERASSFGAIDIHAPSSVGSFL